MTEVTIRQAGPEDGAAFAEIYAPYVRETAVSFEYEPPGKEEFARRIREIGSEYPCLACEAGGRVVAYAYAHRHMERAAYQWNVELSIYTRPDSLGRGLGKALYGAILGISKLQGVQTAYGLVTWPNENSGRLHQSMGFRLLCVIPRMGYKLGQWRDVAWFAKELGDHEGSPAPFIPVGRMDEGVLSDILSRWSARASQAWNRHA